MLSHTVGMLGEAGKWLLKQPPVSRHEVKVPQNPHSASKQRWSVIICSRRFGASARINYEFINITLWSGYFPPPTPPPLSLLLRSQE